MIAGIVLVIMGGSCLRAAIEEGAPAVIAGLILIAVGAGQIAGILP